MSVMTVLRYRGDAEEQRLSDELAVAIRERMKRPPQTAWEKREEMISFVLGMVGRNSKMTREEVEDRLNKMYGYLPEQGSKE